MPALGWVCRSSRAVECLCPQIGCELWCCRPPLILFVQVFEMGDGMGMGGTGGPPVVADVRAAAAVPMASPEVADMWTQVSAVTSGEVPSMGLSAGERPAADVEVLCSAVASVEFELARRMVAAARAGSLPLVGDGAMLLARGWSTGWARRLARAGAFARGAPRVGGGVGLRRDHQRTRPRARAARRPPDGRADGGGDHRVGPVVGSAVPGGGCPVRGPGDPGPEPTPRSGTRRGRRPRGPVPVVRADLRLGDPVRGACPASKGKR